MKTSLPLTLLALTLLFALSVSAQSKKFFAVTGEQFGSTNWVAFRQADLNTKNIRTLYIPAAVNEAVYDAISGAQIINVDAKTETISTLQNCGCINSRMVAAIAYDAKNNRLYYTQMLGSQLRYLDLNSTTPKAYSVTTQLLKNFKNAAGEASVITRMVIASDGNGYALTNDNEHLIRFSTGKQTKITDLGRLLDAPANGDKSVRTQFTSWGGDMIADASGNLYLFTMMRQVYKINPNTRLATFLGEIKNIPQDYNINAAMVEDAEHVIVGSSTQTTGYYRVNLTTLQAAIISTAEQVYNVSDFANGNFAFDNRTDAIAKTLETSTVSAYPNPVTTGRLQIQFSNFKNGKYIIMLSETGGKTILKKEVKISGSQTENISVSAAAGAYLVSVINANGETVYSNKIIVSKD
ncbi:T9SS type A sorting domain-containing protein [Parafilimonas terrae]|uniref:Por secretion system C-terminal sorting domain-containing protein n=1 Tax=Parafilimonas terrae TaxID=1465490 RepID=A0A1I5SCG0_9BACT|nr:T9SS type A sorting domain-containing protein [Parafilimonas terrae]SFP68389.1 Por secretion system C-terminal sorting domain-containing protein [Parafilimonas terrae]